MLLFGVYLVLIVIGMREWRRSLPPRRMQPLDVERLCRAPRARRGRPCRSAAAWARACSIETYRSRAMAPPMHLKVAAEPVRESAGWIRPGKCGCSSAPPAARSCAALGVLAMPTRAVLLVALGRGPAVGSREVAAPANLNKWPSCCAGCTRSPLPRRRGVISPLQWIEIYDGGACRGGRCSPERSGAAQRGCASRAARSLPSLPRVAGVVCHSDLHAMNLI